LPRTVLHRFAKPKANFIRYDIAHQRVALQDASTTDPSAQGGVFGGSYNAATGEYHFIVTAYLQDLIRGKTVDYGTFLAPVDPTVQLWMTLAQLQVLPTGQL
jgi:hypothetical protein